MGSLTLPLLDCHACRAGLARDSFSPPIGKVVNAKPRPPTQHAIPPRVPTLIGCTLQTRVRCCRSTSLRGRHHNPRAPVVPSPNPGVPGFAAQTPDDEPSRHPGAGASPPVACSPSVPGSPASSVLVVLRCDLDSRVSIPVAFLRSRTVALGGTLAVAFSTKQKPLYAMALASCYQIWILAYRHLRAFVTFLDLWSVLSRSPEVSGYNRRKLMAPTSAARHGAYPDSSPRGYPTNPCCFLQPTASPWFFAPTAAAHRVSDIDGFPWTPAPQNARCTIPRRYNPALGGLKRSGTWGAIQTN